MATQIPIVQWSRKVRMTKEQLVRFQVYFLCHLKGLKLSYADLECLTILGLLGTPRLSDFCNKMKEIGIFKSVQSTRNALGKMQELGLVTKSGPRGATTVGLTEEMNVEKKGNVLVDIKCYSPEDVS